jgi:xanthine dehydrogenase YagT iron-sulfur-binding subunit
MSGGPLSRRDLLRGLGTAAVAVGCVREHGTGVEPSGEVGTPGAIDRATQRVSFTLDGKPTTVDVETRTTLLAALRIDLGSTVTKEVCDRGSCGACMVLVDDLAHNACMMLAHDVEGRAVTTAAGLGGAAEPSALQRAFVAHDALQCGFCTPGMLVSAEGLLRRRAGQVVSESEVVDAICGNTCRCGTYPHVVAAVVAASKERARG